MTTGTHTHTHARTHTRAHARTHARTRTHTLCCCSVWHCSCLRRAIWTTSSHWTSSSAARSAALPSTTLRRRPSILCPPSRSVNGVESSRMPSCLPVMKAGLGAASFPYLIHLRLFFLFVCLFVCFVCFVCASLTSCCVLPVHSTMSGPTRLIPPRSSVCLRGQTASCGRHGRSCGTASSAMRTRAFRSS